MTNLLFKPAVWFFFLVCLSTEFSFFSTTPTVTVNALGFSNLIGLVAARRKRAANVFALQCKVARREGLLAADGRRWTVEELNEQIVQNAGNKRGARRNRRSAFAGSGR